VSIANLVRLAVTAALGFVLWELWYGFTIPDVIKFAGLERQLRDIRIDGFRFSDLRYPLIPVYVVFALWVAEKIASLVPSSRR
jgi:hypothetical protein